MAKANDVPQFGLLNGLKVLSCGQVTAEPHATSLERMSFMSRTASHPR